MHVYGAVGCMYAVVGCKSMETLGCMSMAGLGAKYAEVACKVYGYFCHIQEDLVRFMSCGVMQQQKHPLVVLPNVQFAD